MKLTKNKSWIRSAEPVLDYEKLLGINRRILIHGKVMFDIGRDASENIAASYGWKLIMLEEENLEKSDYYYEDVYYNSSPSP